MTTMKNPCLRPACMSDVATRHISCDVVEWELNYKPNCFCADLELQSLYDAEWQKRGFERSP